MVATITMATTTTMATITTATTITMATTTTATATMADCDRARRRKKLTTRLCFEEAVGARAVEDGRV